MEPNQPQTEQPTINPDELKMPEEHFGATEPPSRSSSAFIPLLVGILIILLIVLGALVVWGEDLIQMIQPDGGADTEATAVATTTETATTTEETAPEDSLAEIESDLESTDFESIDAELEAIDAELNASSTAE